MLRRDRKEVLQVHASVVTEAALAMQPGDPLTSLQKDTQCVSYQLEGHLRIQTLNGDVGSDTQLLCRLRHSIDDASE